MVTGIKKASLARSSSVSEPPSYFASLAQPAKGAGFSTVSLTPCPGRDRLLGFVGPSPLPFYIKGY